ncbi:hypothetical protein, partial [Staphylococcus aureus]
SAVLSAPARVTNILVSVVDNTVKHGEAELPLKELETIFTALFQGLAERQPNLDTQPLFDKLSRSLGQLRQYVHGMNL